MRGSARRWIWGVVAVLGLACAGESPEGSGERSGGLPAGPASVLLVTLDTTRADRLEPYGATDVRTPSLAALAARGIVFEHAVAVAPITAPSHASLLTGLYPPGHGVHGNGTQRLPATIPTLAQILLASGYRTAGFVSAAVLERRYGLDRGFEDYDDDLATSGARREARMMLERPAGVTVDRALAWLSGLEPRQRFFLWVHLFDPHTPYQPPEPWSRYYADRPYDGEVAYVDAELGRLLGHPRLADDETLVAVVGDHGESRGEHGEETHGLLIYESTLRIPWILRLPGGPVGERVTVPVSQVDLLPTVLESLGLEPPSGRIDGRSLAAVLAGEPLDRTLYSESEVALDTYGWAKLHSVREGDWKYIAAPQEELYDLGRDPQELENLAAREVDRVDHLARALEGHLTEPLAQPESVATDETTRARLEALGYAVRDGAPGPTSGSGDPKLLIDLHERLQVTAALLAIGRPEQAVRELRELLERDPENLGILRQLVRGLVLSDRLDEAAEVAARARASAPAAPSALMAQADVEFRRDDPAAALAFVEQALALDPGLFEARLERARVLASLGRRDEAAAELAALRAEYGPRPPLELRQAEVVDLPAGRLHEAERRLSKALEIDPFMTEGWALLAQALGGQQRPEEALAACRRGLEFNPGDRLLELRLALALAATGDPTGEAAKIWQAHRQRYPRSARASINLASLALQRQDWGEAERLAREAAEREPGLATVWNTLGIASEQQDRAEEALAAYRRGVEVDPEYWQVRLNYGALLQQQGRADEAESELLQVLARAPDQPGAHFALGLIYAGPRLDRARARQHLEASVRLQPDSPRAAEARRILDTLGEAAD